MARQPTNPRKLVRFVDEWDVLPRSTSETAKYYDLGPQDSCSILGYFVLEAKYSAKLYAASRAYLSDGLLLLAVSFQETAQEQRAVVSMLRVRWERAVREETRRGYRFVREPDGYHWRVERFKPQGRLL